MNFTKRDLQYFELAKNVARLSNYKVKIGAIIVENGDIIATSFNGAKTHPMQMKYNAYRDFNNASKFTEHIIHAELGALIKIKRIKLKNASIYVNRTSSKEFSKCRPCKGCQQALRDYGVKDIYYTTDDGYSYEYWDKS